MRIEENKDLPGIAISAGLLKALGFLWGFYAVFFTILEIAGWRHGQLAVKSTFALVLLSVICWLCIRAARALREARRWGAYVAMLFGMLLLFFAGTVISDMFHPERQVNDEGYALLLVPFIVGVGLWWCVYLNLPRVRARFKAGTIGE